MTYSTVATVPGNCCSPMKPTNSTVPQVPVPVRRSQIKEVDSTWKCDCRALKLCRVVLGMESTTEKQLSTLKGHPEKTRFTLWYCVLYSLFSECPRRVVSPGYLRVALQSLSAIYYELLVPQATTQEKSRQPWATNWQFRHSSRRSWESARRCDPPITTSRESKQLR